MSPWQRLGVIALYLATYCVIVLVALDQARPNHGDILLALLGLLVVRLLPLLAYRASFGWFHPLVLGSLLRLIGVVRYFGVYAYGLHSHPALPGYSADRLNELLALSLVLETLGLVAYYGGYWLWRSRAGRPLQLPRGRHLLPKILVAVAISLGAALAFLAQRGGLEEHILAMGRGRDQAIAGSHYWLMLAMPGIAACWVWVAYDAKCYRRPLLWLCALVSFVLPFLLWGSRGSVVYYVLVGLVVLMLRVRKVYYTRILLLGVVAIYMLAVLGEVRRSAWFGDEVYWEQAVEGSITERLSEAGEEIRDRNREASGVLPILARVPQFVDYLQGESYLAVLTLPVPRGLWEDKPGMTAGRVGQVFYNRNAGIPPGPVGEAYWNFDIPGILVVFFLFGIFHRWLAGLLRTNHTQPAVLVLYAASLMLFRQPTTLGFVHAMWAIVPLVVVLLAFGLIGPRVRSSPVAVPHTAR